MSKVAKKNGKGDKIFESWSCWSSNSKYLLHNTNLNLMQHVQDVKVNKFTLWKKILWMQETYNKFELSTNSCGYSP